MEQIQEDTVIYMFAALQGLEKCVEQCEQMLRHQPQQPETVAKNILEQHRMLKMMRRSANKAQLEVAKKDWKSARRSVQLFYGLNQLVRPEVVSTFAALSDKQIGLRLEDSDITLH